MCSIVNVAAAATWVSAVGAAGPSAEELCAIVYHQNNTQLLIMNQVYIHFEARNLSPGGRGSGAERWGGLEQSSEQQRGVHAPERVHHLDQGLNVRYGKFTSKRPSVRVCTGYGFGKESWARSASSVPVDFVSRSGRTGFHSCWPPTDLQS